MKTKKLSILFPAVFAIVSMLVSCNSVGYTQEKPSIYIESQKIVTPGGLICVDLDQDTQCPKVVKDCKTNTELKEFISRAAFFEKVSQGVKVNYIVGSPCNSFIADIVGNTTYYCTPWKCYPR
jgi:hypothetical protein